jgi:RNA polymerase sigma-70 factor (ECF subfamily)
MSEASRGEREAALEAALAEHYARVFGVLYRLVGDRAEAEDLALETFWRLWQRPPAPGGRLGSWLCRVAVRLGYNALRAAERRRQHEAAAGPGLLDLAAPPNPEAAAEAALARQRVRRVLAEMAPRQAQLLVLRHSGLSYREVADALGIAPGSVGTLLARAEAEFERRYGED